jgi:hypothetical protein
MLVAGFGAADKAWLHWYVPDSARQPEPDRIVGVLHRCNMYNAERKIVDITGSLCEGEGGPVFNRTIEITARTSQGTAYTVKTSDIPKVTIGDKWPK